MLAKMVEAVSILNSKPAISGIDSYRKVSAKKKGFIRILFLLQKTRLNFSNLRWEIPL
jgi:hypothetical protein